MSMREEKPTPRWVLVKPGSRTEELCQAHQAAVAAFTEALRQELNQYHAGEGGLVSDFGMSAVFAGVGPLPEGLRAKADKEYGALWVPDRTKVGREIYARWKALRTPSLLAFTRQFVNDDLLFGRGVVYFIVPRKTETGRFVLRAIAGYAVPDTIDLGQAPLLTAIIDSELPRVARDALVAVLLKLEPAVEGYFTFDEVPVIAEKESR